MPGAVLDPGKILEGRTGEDSSRVEGPVKALGTEVRK